MSVNENKAFVVVLLTSTARLVITSSYECKKTASTNRYLVIFTAFLIVRVVFTD